MLSKHKILLCGHRSFAAKGLDRLLEEAGHEVSTFSRGPMQGSGTEITGPVDRIHENPHLSDSYDTVINYIFLSDRSIEENEIFVESLLKLCTTKRVRHLIHVSSISVFKRSDLIDEDVEVETNPLKKGSYGALKVAQDEYLREHLPDHIRLTLVRPGFILGEGLVDPIVGTGFRTPWNRLLAIGNGQSCIPLTTRDLVNEAMLKIVSRMSDNRIEVFVLADSDSPTREKYLDACARLLGAGMKVVTLPVALWSAAAFGGEIALRLLGKGELKPWQKISAACQKQRFDTHSTGRELNLTLSFDWQKALSSSLDSQLLNFSLPYVPSAELKKISVKRVTFLGFGRIVHQKHLPALVKLGHPISIDAYDIASAKNESHPKVRFIEARQIEASDLFVVATPGPAHIAALDLLESKQGRILLEKPLCYSLAELQKWTALDEKQPDRIFICHNYRLKNNVQKMLIHLQKFNPGRLLNVSLSFQSPSVSKDGAPWLRKERTARTLLMDYGLHFLDLACMFHNGEWKVDTVRYELNSLNQTSLIDGALSGNGYSVHFLLRQGFIPRKANIVYTFQNYSISLRFFPDTFMPHMSSDSGWLHKREGKQLNHYLHVKLLDKLFSKDSDLSHCRVYSAVCGDNGFIRDSISLKRLHSFYQLMFKLGRSVYEQ